MNKQERAKRASEKEKAKRDEAFDLRQGLLFQVYRPDAEDEEERRRAKLSWVLGEGESWSLPSVAEWANMKAAQEAFLRKLDDGTDCPCCGRFAKVYARKINNNMARTMIWMCRVLSDMGALFDRNVFLDVPKIAPRWVVRTNQFPALRWWGLMERLDSKDDQKRKHIGMWRPTRNGIQFAHGELTVDEKVYTLFGRVIGFGGKKVSIEDCFGRDFDYSEVMRPLSVIRAKMVDQGDGVRLLSRLESIGAEHDEEGVEDE